MKITIMYYKPIFLHVEKSDSFLNFHLKLFMPSNCYSQ